jgi:hypothetical protein
MQHSTQRNKKEMNVGGATFYDLVKLFEDVYCDKHCTLHMVLIIR